MPDHDTTHSTPGPLLSNRFLSVATAVIAVLALSSLAISFAGKHYGHQLALANHSDSTTPIKVAIGRDVLTLPENTLRFAVQRVSKAHEQVDLYLSWPEMRGYEDALRSRFNSTHPAGIVFLQISQSTMTRDMSGRLDPIYRQLLGPGVTQGPGGLEERHFLPGTGYEGEVLLTGTDKAGHVYAVRCLDPARGSAPTSSDCQRDIHLGRDMSVLYRFPRNILHDWENLESAIRTYIQSRLSPATSS
ncbi:hypothetical protein [Peteryoungia ipomoeae]|uniref:Uncharacterized protein n=1 Tax=Peteryoungia ipomoeae TaxID=1210932 RepID=A0A4S8P582_9HYPH|nr:hypothetical protein [Peteryoungia ipomoeae]THV25268.1 hypothetical protein FAA97_03435 [Peteryoungia ipomoeae]